MSARVVKWFVLCLLLLAGAWLFWHQSGQRAAKNNNNVKAAPAVSASPGSLPAAMPLTNPALVSASEAKTNRLAYRLSNTTTPFSRLVNDPHAILLENALIDSSRPVNFTFPTNLQSQGDPGAYIVQSRGPINAAFRAALAGVGAQIVSYIPNNAYLVRISGAGAGGLAAQPQVQSVIPYEPYYKISASMPVTVGTRSVSSAPQVKTNQTAGPSLLALAVKQSPLPAGTYLTLGLLKDGVAATAAQIERLGGRIVARDSSPFGPVLRVRPPAIWTALATLPGVQIVEPFHPRVAANDLSRVTVGVSTNTVTAANYMNLSGKNVIVDVNDTGIDAAHPDFTTGGSAIGGLGSGGAPIRVIGDVPQSLVDINGHGTFVAGEIAGNGAASYTTMSNRFQFAEGSVSNADFRGKAPLATLYSVAGVNGGADPFANSDQYLQEQAALTNALISNNSWGYGDNAYDLAAASYDAATRDALPLITGSQPVLFVFAAGNDGLNGANGANGGTAGTITSPGTAKDVITVGALEQFRNITNMVTALNGTSNAVWQSQTANNYQVAPYSSLGNVGIGIEGAFGRFKPDVAAPGSFVVSTRSSQWATNAYYNPTNYTDNTVPGLSLAATNGLQYYSILVPQNAISLAIQIQTNINSPVPFPTNLLIYVNRSGFPNPNGSYDLVEPNQVSIPPNAGGAITGIQSLQGLTIHYALFNTNAQAVGSYNIFTQVATTNNLGNYYSVLEGMNDSLGGYYRYESGTSMAAADVSGTLALMADFFTNTLQQTPSPALLKAMLINGARPTALYNLEVTNSVNYEGWGLINLPDSVPTNNPASYNGSMPSSIYIQDQSPTNALATGDTHTFAVTVQTNNAPLRVTLAWTDPPGDPIAAIKLVNSLELVVSNASSGYVYYGNDIPASSSFNNAENPTNVVPADAINNVQSVIIPAPLGANYIVSVIGRDVNVNAVSAQTNLYAGPPNTTGVYAPNVVQDYALVISSGSGGAPGSFTVTDNGIVSNPTGGQDITVISTTNTANSLLDQFVGANSPVLNTNTIPFTSNTAYGTAEDTTGTTNQWHFYVVTNTGPTSDYTNAAFVIYSATTLSVPRMGVFTGSDTNATLPSANIDLYATTDPTFTNLNPLVISNCINNFSNRQNVYYNASLIPGGAKFLVDTNSTPGEVYYIGVKSEDQMASEYSFLSVFSNVPFNQNANGDQVISGLTIPVAIPGGSPSVPGFVDVVAISPQPITVGWVVVTNVIQQQDVGDLVSSLSFNNITVGLMSHNSPNSPGTFGFVYDDSGVVNPAITPLPPGYTLQNSGGPGSLQNFIGQNASSGVWVFHLANSAAPFTGSVQLFNLRIHPQLPATSGETNTIPGHSYQTIAVDVPAGATNLTINATNISPTGILDPANPLLMVLKFGSVPTLTNADKGPVPLTNGVVVGTVVGGVVGAGLGNSLSVGPTDVPPIQPGVYWVGITNQSDTAQTYTLIAVILPPNPIPPTTDFASIGSTALLDDAVTYSDIFVTNTQTIISLNAGIVVQHPRISDLAFYLISPDGTRDLLMENRGGETTNGAGAVIIVTNVFSGYSSGGAAGATNFYDLGETSGTIPITWNFYTIPDIMDVYYQTNLIFSTGLVGGTGSTNLSFGPGTSTQIEVVMDSTNVQPGTLWNYTIGSLRTNFAYLSFTEDTNLTTTPIKFAVPPFVPLSSSGIVWTDSFEAYTPVTTPTTNAQGMAFGNWIVLTNAAIITTNPPAFAGTNLLALQNGAVSNNLPTLAGQRYVLSYEIGSIASDSTNTLSNAGWQAVSVTFTATQTNTPLVLDASGGGFAANSLVAGFSSTNLLFDDFVLTELPGNLYDQPEQSLDLFDGKSAYGDWQLEIQDDRSGAGLTNTLVSWNLQFVFANTNAVPTVLTGGIGLSNQFLPAGAIAWYQVNVPGNANYATNILLYSSAPVNVWFDTNSPPATNILLLADPMYPGGTNGTVLLSTTNTTSLDPNYQPQPNIYDDQTYYLGVLNTNTFTINYGIEVDFDHGNATSAPPAVVTLPATNVLFTTATLNAQVDPNGLTTTVYFEYGTNTSYGFFSTPVVLTSNLNAANILGIGVTNLLPGTTYHFQAIGVSGAGTNYGGDLTFTTLVETPAPFAFTQPAQSVTGGGAQLNGMATPNGLPAMAWFQWGTTTLYGSNTPPVNVGAGTNVVFTTNQITGLVTNVAYHFRLVVSNAEVVVYGFDQILDEANVVAWGANYANQLNVPAGLSNAMAVAGAYDHSLALNNNGIVAGWGDNTFSQATVPVGLSNVVAIAGGEYYSLALKSNGTVAAWGANILTQTNVPAGLSNVVEIAGGTFSSVALKNDGSVVAWGANFFNLTPAPAGLSNVVAIAGGSYHSLAVLNNGLVTAWGDDSAGQTNVPPGLSNVVAIAGGSYHSLALKYDGTVVAWGDDSAGQTNVPPGLSNVVAIAAGGFHSLALKNDGSLVIWGDNSAGQQNVPSGLTNFVAISAGYFHTLALTPQVIVNVTNQISNTTNGVPQTNGILPGGVTFYQVQVPTNAEIATNILVSTGNGSLNLWFSTNSPPTIGQTNDTLLLAGVTNGSAILSATTQPPLVPGSFYWLGVQNTNSVTVNYQIEVDFLLAAPVGAITNAVRISSIVYTNISGTNGFLLTWCAPSNDLFQVQWTASLSPANWSTFTNIVSYNVAAFTSPTNTQFNFFDDGSQTGVFGPLRFYRLILLQATNTLALPVQTNIAVTVSTAVTVTNTAVDSLAGAVLSYSLVNAPTNASISTNGVITWTNATPAGIAQRFTTIVTDNGLPPLTTSNTFTVFVLPLPAITNVIATATNVTLQWSAPTNDMFQVQWATNLSPVINWFTFPNILTSTDGVFTFTDTNAPLIMKFYRLLLLP